MGQFSWLDCITGEQVIDDKIRNVYVLVPKEFGGGKIREKCYDGYGNFGGHDIYDLVVDWNRGSIPEEVLRVPKRSQWGNRPEDDDFYDNAIKSYQGILGAVSLLNNGKSDDELLAYVREHPDFCWDSQSQIWKREVGIAIACYDDQNAALKYPIKITHDPTAVYEQCGPSKGDPDQGWSTEYDTGEDPFEDENRAYLQTEIRSDILGIFDDLGKLVHENAPFEDPECMAKMKQNIADIKSRMEETLEKIEEL